MAEPRQGPVTHPPLASDPARTVLVPKRLVDLRQLFARLSGVAIGMPR
jgi:hypothetical protein